MVTHSSGYETHTDSSILISWRRMGVELIPQTKNPTNVGLDVVKRVKLF